MISLKHKLTGLLLAATCLVPVAAPALADDKPAAPAAPVMWSDTIAFTLQAEGGILFNTASPRDGGNFGHLFTDHPNTPMLNQVLFGVARPIDPKSADYDFGFKLQGMWGTDARYTRWYNFGTGQNSRYQFDLIEANVQLHAPVLAPGGIDFKLGMYATPIGYETIDPSTNVFYSHSYIFNFGLPLKHTGLLTTTHVNDLIDIYLGADTGVNTTLVPYRGDNNSSFAFLGGVGLNLMDGNLTILALTHIGPENTGSVTPLANRSNRYYADTVITYKATEALTFITELNFVHDDYNFGGIGQPTAFGAAQYVTYALSDTVTVGARAEVFRDDKNFFVASFPGNNDFNNIFSGRPGSVVVAPGSNTTYGALTVGLTYKPSLAAWKLPGTLMVRPEMRYDTALTSNKPYNGGRDKGSFTIGSDFVLTF